MGTQHFIKDRRKRLEFIKKNIGYGEKVERFVWDRGHVNGAEYHTVTSTALIVVRNVNTMKLVTVLVARPGQLRRLYGDREVPKYLIDLAIEHQRKGWNEI